MNIWTKIQSAEEQVPEGFRGFSPKSNKLVAANDGRYDAKAGLPCDPAYPEWMIYRDAYKRAYNRQIARQQS